jgi:hypothetical protein
LTNFLRWRKNHELVNRDGRQHRLDECKPTSLVHESGLPIG